MPEFVREMDRLLDGVDLEIPVLDGRDLERESKQIVDLFKKVINDLVSVFGGKGIVVNGNHVMFRQVVRVVEMILYHGLYEWKNGNVLSFRRVDLWELVSETMVQGKNSVCINTVESVNNICENHGNRIWTWIKLSFMNHTLTQSLKMFVDLHREDMSLYYRRYSCLNSDHVFLIMSLLGGLDEFDFDINFRDDDGVVEREDVIEKEIEGMDVYVRNEMLERELGRIEQAQMVTIQQNRYYAERNKELEESNRAMSVAMEVLNREMKEMDAERKSMRDRLEMVEKKCEMYYTQIVEYKKIVAKQTG